MDKNHSEKFKAVTSHLTDYEGTQDKEVTEAEEAWEDELPEDHLSPTALQLFAEQPACLGELRKSSNFSEGTHAGGMASGSIGFDQYTGACRDDGLAGGSIGLHTGMQTVGSHSASEKNSSVSAI